VIVTVVFAATGAVVIRNEPVNWMDGARTVEGTLATAGLLLENEISTRRTERRVDLDELYL